MTTLNRWQRTVVDLAGNIAPGAVLMIRRESDQALVTVYKDRAGTDPHPMGQVTADGMGYAYFYAPADLYRITSAAPVIDWRDVDIGAAAAQQIAQQALDSALPTYETVTEMNADTGQDVPTLGRVVNAVDPGDNGYYVWDGSTWDRSSYQPASDADVQDRLRKDQNLADLDDAATARDNLGLGTAAVEDVEAFATAAQGGKADSAVQPARKVEGSDGLAGGGDLSADRIITLSPTTKYKLDQYRAALNVARYGDGPYPVLDAVFGGGASLLDPRITFTRPGKSWRTVNGVIREYDVNEPVLTPEGWSMWPAGTNTYSPSAYKNPSFFGGGSYSEALGVTAPDSSSGAGLFTESAETRDHYFDFYTGSAGDSETFTIFLKANGCTKISLAILSNTSGTKCRAAFDLSAVTAAASVGNARIKPMAGGWYRCDVYGALTGGSGWYSRVQLLGPGGESSYAGDGVSGVHFWGIIRNAGDPIPYIPTTTGAVTRPADNALIQDAFPSVWSPVEGAVLVDLTVDTLLSNNWLWSCSDGTLTNYAGIAYQHGSYLGTAGGGLDINTAGSQPIQVPKKMILTWDASDFAFFVDGVKIGEKAHTGSFGRVNRAYFAGLNDNAVYSAALTMRRHALFQQRLPDAQAEAWTS